MTSPTHVAQILDGTWNTEPNNINVWRGMSLCEADLDNALRPKNLVARAKMFHMVPVTRSSS